MPQTRRLRLSTVARRPRATTGVGEPAGAVACAAGVVCALAVVALLVAAPAGVVWAAAVVGATVGALVAAVVATGVVGVPPHAASTTAAMSMSSNTMGLRMSPPGTASSHWPKITRFYGFFYEAAPL